LSWENEISPVWRAGAELPPVGQLIPFFCRHYYATLSYSPNQPVFACLLLNPSSAQNYQTPTFYAQPPLFKPVRDRSANPTIGRRHGQ
jgi:hypothetical protein